MKASKTMLASAVAVLAVASVCGCTRWTVVSANEPATVSAMGERLDRADVAAMEAQKAADEAQRSADEAKSRADAAAAQAQANDANVTRAFERSQEK